MKGTKSMFALSAALGMLLYAIPKLHVGDGLTPPTLFAVIWIGFALVVVAAHLHDLLGVDEETRAELEKVRAMKRWQLEQKLTGRSKLLQLRK